MTVGEERESNELPVESSLLSRCVWTDGVSEKEEKRVQNAYEK